MEKKIPETALVLANEYNELAVMDFIMGYYDLYEGLNDGTLDNVGQYDDEFRKITEVIADAALNMITKEKSDEEILDALADARSNLIGRMEELTAYTDYFRVHEYVLNRTGFAVEGDVSSFDNDEEAKAVLRHIFSDDDNMVINIRIQQMIAQLPVRITSKRFFELLKDSLSVYKDSQRESLKGYMYMLRSAAGINANGAKYYEDLDDYKKQFADADYKNLTSEKFAEYDGLLGEISEMLTGRSELCIAAQYPLNNLYAYYLTRSFSDTKEIGVDAANLIKDISEKFKFEFLNNGEFGIIDEELMSKVFADYEGRPERLVEKISKHEGALESVKDELKSVSEECLAALDKTSALMSTSNFVDVEAGVDVTECTSEIIDDSFETLYAEFNALFESCEKKVRRAVMASVLKEFPVFFVSHTEVMDYLRYTLDSCRDNAEKRASIDLLWKEFND